MTVDDRDHRALNEFDVDDEKESSEESVVLEEDSSDVEGDLFL
jgi:hypothetical protein